MGPASQSTTQRPPPGWARAADSLARGIETLQRDPTVRLMALGVLIGAAGGLVAFVFDFAVAALGELIHGIADPELGGGHRLAALLGPVVGGLIAGLAVRYGTREGQPFGIPDVIDATWNRHGTLSLRNGAATALGAAAAIGGGQSGGREGPVVQLAGAVSSHLCRRLGVPRNRARVLVAAGAAAGIAASFNTPVGAAFFALEIILGNFAMNMFGPVVAATVTGTVVGQALLGDRVALHLPEFGVQHPVELVFYLLLGGLCGGLALLFRWSLFAIEDRWSRIQLPAWVRPGVTGLLVGVIAFAGIPAVMGNGYFYMEALVRGETGQSGAVLVLVLVAKLVATGLTNAGRTGAGLFAPSLFLGAVLGTAYGTLVHGAWPGLTESAGVYGMVGMGAVAAAMTHSPITIALMLFEMTRNYEVILPLLLTLAVAGIVVSAFGGESLFVEQLARRGVKLVHGREELVLYDITVGDLLRASPANTVAPDTPFEDLAACFLHQHDDEVFVVEAGGRLHGVVELLDIKHLLMQPREGLRAVDVETRDIPRLSPGQPVAEAMPLFFQADVDELPVVDDEGRLVGTLHERDVVGALDREVLRHDALLARVESEQDGERRTDFLELPPGQVLGAVFVRRGLAGQSLRELDLTRRYHATVLAVVRPHPQTGKEERHCAEADFVVEEGDRLVVMGPRADVDMLCAGAEDLARTEEVPRC